MKKQKTESWNKLRKQIYRELEEGEGGMSDEAGDRIDGEEEVRVRAVPRNKPTQQEREERVATHVPFRDWCTHCTMDRGRTNDLVSKQKSEDQSRRPTIAMEYYFMKMKSVVNAQTISEESVTCIAVERRRTSQRHEQCCVEEGRRRTVDNRKSGEIH